MTDTINGRTPEEIKRGLECCVVKLSCEDCPYRVGNPSCLGEMRKDLLALINQLQEDKKQLERERDAAVEQLRKGGRACSTCKFSEDIPENDKICEECRLTGTKLLYSNWEWVGPQEVE